MQKDNYFIFSHKDITCPVGYEIIDNRNSELDHRIWSELAGFKIVYDRIVALSEDTTTAQDVNDMWLYLNQYRRRFPVDCYRRTYIPQPMTLPVTVANNYAIYHNIDDLQLCGTALKEEFPHLAQPFEQVMNGNLFIPYNIAVLTGSQFKDYCNFLLKVLENLHKKIGTDTFEDRVNYIKSNPEKYTGENKNNDPVYQARIESFCAERLSSFYWIYISKQMPIYPAELIKTEGAF